MKQKNHLFVAALGPVTRFSIIVCASLCTATHVGAADQTWTGAANADWTNTGNWNGGAAPGVADLVTFDNTSLLNLTITRGTPAAAASIKGIVVAGPLGPAGPVTVSTGNVVANTDVTADPGSDFLTAASNPLLNDDLVYLPAGTAPSGLALGTAYFVVNQSGNTFQVSATKGGSPLLFTSTGSALKITGGRTFTLNSTGVNMSAATQNLSLNGPNYIPTGQTMNVGDGRTLTMPGIIAGTAGTTLAKSGTGLLDFSGLVTAWPGGLDAGAGKVRLRGNTALNSTYLGFLTGAGTVYVSQGSNNTLTLDSNVAAYGIKDFTGTVEVNAGAARHTQPPGAVGSKDEMTGTTLDLQSGGNLTAHQAWTNTRTYRIGALKGLAGSLVTGSTGNANATTEGTVEYQIGAKELATTFGGIIRNGTGNPQMKTGLDKVGLEVLTLTGENTYTGITKVTAGTLSIGDGGASGSLAATNVAVAADGTLVFNRDNTSISSYPGVLSGSGAVIKKGNGQVNFNGTNLHSAGTEIQGGTIGINSASSLGTGGVTFTTANGGVVSNATGILEGRTFNVAAGITATFGASLAANSLDIQSPVTGDGSVNVSGSGVVIFSGDNEYIGTTTVTSGTLVASSIDSTSTGAVTVNTGGNLAGAGTITGPATVSGGLKPGALTAASSSVGDLNLSDSLALNGGSTLYVEFASTTSYDRVLVAGAITTDATTGNRIKVDLRSQSSPLKWSTPAPGGHNIISFGGTFPGNPNDLFEVTPDSQQAGNSYDFSIVGQSVRLTISAAVLPSEWNVNGNGNWSTTGNWLNGEPSGQGANAVFGNVITAPRVVTLDGNRTVGTLRFDNTNAYTIAGPNTLNLDQTTGNAEISVLLGNHIVASDVSLTDSVTLAFADPSQSVELTGEVSGAGGITKTGGGNLTLSGPNTFLGDVSFASGSLAFGAGGLGDGDLSLDGTSLVWMTGNTQDISDRVVTFGVNPIILDVGGNNVILSNGIGGASATPISKLGSGKLTLEADQGFTGAMTISGGVLQLGNAGTTGFITGNIINNGGLIVSRSNDVTMFQTLSGSGSLEHAGASVLTLGAANSFSGQTTITQALGGLKLANSLALQGSTLNYDSAGGSLNFGTLTLTTLGGLSGDKDLALTNNALTPAAVALTVGGNGETTAYSGDFSGTGSLVKTGTGILTLTGQHAYGGTTTVSGGVLKLGSAGVISTSATTVNAALLNIDGGSFTSAGTAQINSGGANGFLLSSGSATVATIQTSTGDGNLIAVAGGTFTAASVILQRTASAGNGDDPTNPAATTSGFVVTDGIVSITTALNIGTSNSAASALFDGGSSVISGLLSVGNNTVSGRWNILEVRNGEFESTGAAGVLLSPYTGFANKSQFLVTGGVATVEKVSFGGANPASGAIGRLTLSGGTLYVGAGGLAQSTPGFTSQIQLWGGVLAASAPWSTPLPMDLLGFSTIKAANSLDEARDITLTGALTGSGGLIKEGAGILTLSGGHAYTNATVVRAGTLRVTTRTFSDDAVVEVNNVGTGSALQLSYSGGDRVASFRIEEVEQLPGVYGRVGSGAQYVTAAITGNGLLYVNTELPPATGFNLWISGTFANGTVPGDKQGPNDDPDNDGIDNLTEYAVAALDPTVGNGSVGTFTGLTLSFAKRQPLAGDITYSIEQSTDLGVSDAWAPVTPAVNDGSTISYTLPGGPPKDFLRLKVLQN